MDESGSYDYDILSINSDLNLSHGSVLTETKSQSRFLTPLSVFGGENTNTSHSRQIDYLCAQNKKLKEAVDEKTFSLDAFEEEILKFKKENFKLKVTIKSLKKQILDLSNNESGISFDMGDVVAEERKKYLTLFEKYQILYDENRNYMKLIEEEKKTKSQNQSLIKEIDNLKEELADKKKQISKLEIDLRRFEPQESIDFQSQLEKIRSVLTAHKEPSVEIKKELDEWKDKCASLKDEIQIKNETIDNLSNELKRKDQKISDLNAKNNESDQGLERLSCLLMESKAKEAELIDMIRSLKVNGKNDNFNVKFLDK